MPVTFAVTGGLAWAFGWTAWQYLAVTLAAMVAEIKPLLWVGLLMQISIEAEHQTGGDAASPPAETHVCDPPFAGGQLAGDRTGMPLGSRWTCGCGDEFMVVLDDYGKTWRKVRLRRWR